MFHIIRNSIGLLLISADNLDALLSKVEDLTSCPFRICFEFHRSIRIFETFHKNFGDSSK